MIRADYNKVKAVNYSSLKHLRPPDGSPLKYEYFQLHRKKDTPAMLLGRATHTATLEPDQFPLEYAVWDGAKRGGKYTAFKEAEEEQGKSILSLDQYNSCIGIRDRVRGHAVAGKLLSSGEPEVTFQWTNRETGIRCKGRADWVIDGDKPIILDLKTTARIEKRSFARHCWDMGTFFQAAMYQSAYATLSDVIPDMGLIAVEQKPPHACCVYWLDMEGLAAAWDEYISCLHTLQDCIKSGEYPGLGEDTLSAPAYVLADQMTQEPLTMGGKEMVL